METLEVKLLSLVPRNKKKKKASFFPPKSQCEHEHPASTVSFKGLTNSWQKQVQRHFPQSSQYNQLWKQFYSFFFSPSFKDPKHIVASYTFLQKQSRGSWCHENWYADVVEFKVCVLSHRPDKQLGRGNTQKVTLKKKSVLEVPSKEIIHEIIEEKKAKFTQSLTGSLNLKYI